MQYFWSYLNGNESFKGVVREALKNLENPDTIGYKKHHSHYAHVYIKK